MGFLRDHGSFTKIDIDKANGISFQHSHFFFEDGTNIGYFPERLIADTPNGYTIERNNLDDCILKEAIRKTPPKPYNLMRIKLVEMHTFQYSYNSMANRYMFLELYIEPLRMSQQIIVTHGHIEY